MDHEAAMALSEVSVSIELETPEMTLNIGPQHPSTHGVLRLVAQVDGERVRDIKPVIGYMHRGYEKISEVRTYPQITALITRWIGSSAVMSRRDRARTGRRRVPPRRSETGSSRRPAGWRTDSCWFCIACE